MPILFTSWKVSRVDNPGSKNKEYIIYMHPKAYFYFSISTKLDEKFYVPYTYYVRYIHVLCAIHTSIMALIAGIPYNIQVAITKYNSYGVNMSQ